MTGIRMNDQRALDEQLVDLIEVADVLEFRLAADHLTAVIALPRTRPTPLPGTDSELRALREWAVHMGLYDADDYLKTVTSR